MKSYNLGEDLNKAIVEGLIDGYQEYVNIRKEKADSMKVSGAYAWVKGNHIDHHVAIACEPFGVQHQLARAGLTWQYLQFQNKDEKVLFIVKNAKYFDEKQVSVGRDAKGRSRGRKMEYMEKLIEINSDINFNEVRLDDGGGSVQLELIEDSILSEEEQKAIALELKNDYDRFYVVTYAIDESQLISKVSLFLPNPENNQAYCIEELDKYIDPLRMEIDEDTKHLLASQPDIGEQPNASLFGIAASEKKEKKEK